METEPSGPADAWESGAAYEPYIGRWSRLVAREFVRRLAAPSGQRWLDAGCGTGALSAIILDVAEPVRVTGIDASEGYIAYARGHVRDARARFLIGDAQALPVPDATYDLALSGLALNFIPRPDRAVAEMVRVTRDGGTVAAYVWDYAGGMQIIRRFWDAAVALDAAARGYDEAVRFPISRPEPLTALFHDAGLVEIDVRPIDVPAVFRDFEDYWSPFLGGQGPAPGYAIALSDEHRSALRERIRAMLPIRSDGSIYLLARAWAVRGTVRSA
jgi:SAM-dependent methyltransferase